MQVSIFFFLGSHLCDITIFQTNLTRACVEVDREKGLVTLVFLRAKVQKAFTLIQINHTNSAFAPQFILIKPNLHSANTLSVSQIIQSKGSKIQCSRTKKRNTPKV